MSKEQIIDRENIPTNVGFRQGHLPRWARVPALIIRTGAAVLTGTAGSVAIDHTVVLGAEFCTGGIHNIGFRFADHPTLGRQKIIDPNDAAIDGDNFTEVQVHNEEGANKLAALARLPKGHSDRVDSGKRPKPIAGRNMANRGGYSYGEIRFDDVECNATDGNKPALKVWLHFPAHRPQDDDFATYPVTIPKGNKRVHVAGRAESRPSALDAIANDKTLQILPVGLNVDRIIQELTGHKLASFEAPEGSDTTISDATKAQIREQAKILLKQEEEEKANRKREEEKKKQGSKSSNPDGTDRQSGQQGNQVQNSEQVDQEEATSNSHQEPKDIRDVDNPSRVIAYASQLPAGPIGGVVGLIAVAAIVRKLWKKIHP